MSLIPLGFWGGGESSPMPQSGLVLHLDAGTPASYPGTGTTWTNLANSNFTTTLVPHNVSFPIVYNSADGGSLLFAGSSQWEPDGADVTSTLANRQTWNSYWDSSDKMTCVAIIKPLLTGDISIRDSIIGQNYYTGLGFGYHVHCNIHLLRAVPAIQMPYSTSQNNFIVLGDGSGDPPSSGPYWENFNNTVIFTAFNHDGATSNVRYWLNNNLYTTNTPQVTTAGTYMTDETNNVQIGTFASAGAWRSKYIYQIAIWNRLLSDTEVTNIYNAYKTRHGYL